MQEDTERIARLKRALSEAKLDALVCRLPENVVFLSGTWPTNGFTTLLFPREGDPVLFVPEGETARASEGWVKDVKSFGWGEIKDKDTYAEIARLLSREARSKGLARRGARIGIEESFEFVAPAYALAEVIVPAWPTRELFTEAFGGGSLLDAAELLNRERGRKTHREIEKLKAANEVCCFGLTAFAENCKPGMRTIEAASKVEEVVSVKGTGHKGVMRVRSFASVVSGPGTVFCHRPNFVTEDHVIEEGELVVMELTTVADGFWSRLSRTLVAGKPGRDQEEALGLVLTAERAATKVIRPGVRAQAVDRAARDLISEGSNGGRFPHGTGQGIGFRSREPVPLLQPDSERVLEEGMVTSVEPGLYRDGFGGIRFGDNVVVMTNGAELLSKEGGPV